MTAKKTNQGILALDLGTKCGYAVLKGRKVLVSGQWKLRTARKDDHRAQRWRRFTANVKQLIAIHKPDLIVYERVRRHVGTTAAHVYGGFLCQLELLDFELNDAGWFGKVPTIIPIEISTWKKISCKNGRATKGDIVQAAKKRFKFNPTSEDEADALMIAEAQRLILSGKQP